MNISGIPLWLSGKESACNGGDAEDVCSIPGLERSPGGGQYSCLKNPMGRGAWCAIVHGGHKQSDMIEAT